MSSKSTRYYNDKKEIHVYFDMADNNHYLECPSPPSDHVKRYTKTRITKEIAEAFLDLEKIEMREICPHCHKEINDW